MAVLRLFAGVKEVAGTDQIEVDVSTVGGLVAEADGRFGGDFVRARSGAKLWLNDDTEIEDLATPIGRNDTVAIIPPVAGGDAAAETAATKAGKQTPKAGTKPARKTAAKTAAKSSATKHKTTTKATAAQSAKR